MLKVLEGIFRMHLNRLSILILTMVFACGASLNAPAIAASQDREKKPKTNKVVVRTTKSTKQQKAVRVTVTRSSEPAPPHPSFATALGLRGQHDELSLKSSVAMVVNQDTQEVYFEKNSSVSLPIASITKLMTAMVVLDSKLPLDETIVINADDVRSYAKSRLAGGTVMTREEALLLALMSSENRAAYTLARNYPGGVSGFVDAMNRKARELGMDHSHFADPTGLMSENVASAEDLARMLSAAYQYKMIREFSTWPDLTMVIANRPQKFLNTNRLVRSGDMNIGLQKTGFINAAGKCLVMQARVNNTPLLLVFLDSVGTQSRFADAVRVRDWYERMPSGTQPVRRLM
ncbi:serine hydrolase [Polynucleobacter campilacus]|jgi:D-alanyl-D-alanine endopeptidase (penicillin-binding protein 7)|nr:serine hydrolase [Polynucleobacter campilacus]